MPFDTPTGDWIERRRANRLTGAQVETGVMPWATNGVADDETVGQRTAVVRAVRTDGQHVRAALKNDHFFLTHLAADDGAAGELGDGNPLRKILRDVRVGHGVAPSNRVFLNANRRLS